METTWGEIIILSEWLEEFKKQGLSTEEALSKLASHMTQPTRCPGISYDDKGRPYFMRDGHRVYVWGPNERP